MTKYEEKRKEVLTALKGKAYDFSVKVAPIYEMLDWKWNRNNKRKTPHAYEIEAHIRSLIDGMISDNSRTTLCGGIKISLHNEVFSKDISYLDRASITMEISSDYYDWDQVVVDNDC